MSTPVLLTTLALASTALSIAWSFELNLDGVKNSRYVVLHRQGCLLWYLMGVVLLGLVFAIAVAVTSLEVIVPIVVAWLSVLGCVVALIVLVYAISKQASGVYKGNQETVATFLTHAVVIITTLIDIYVLYFIAKRELVTGASAA
jgi:FtsH-binding integral membrane protein